MAETNADFLIYGSPASPFVRKVAAFCIEKAIPFDIDPVNIMDTPDWFKEISPLKRIPVLRDRSIATEGTKGTIADSSAICGYIEKHTAAPALYPNNAYDHGRALWLEEYSDTALVPATGLGIFRPIFFSIVQGDKPDLDTARTAWAEKIPPLLDYLEGVLGEREFFAGDAVSVADIAITCGFMQATLVAQTPLDRWPNFKRHFEAMNTRPSIAGPFAKADRFIRKALPERIDLT